MGFLDGMMNKVREAAKDVAPMQIAKILRDPDRSEDQKYESCKSVVKSSSLSNQELREVDRQVRNAYGSSASRAWAKVMRDFQK